jgi:hypothetical protein
MEFDRIIYTYSEKWARNDFVKGHIGVGGAIGQLTL